MDKWQGLNIEKSNLRVLIIICNLIRNRKINGKSDIRMLYWTFKTRGTSYYFSKNTGTK